MREGKAKVLSEAEFKRAINTAKKYAHTKRNVALLYCSFGLGLRAKKMAVLFNYEAPLFRSQKGDAFSPNTMQQLFHQLYAQARLTGASSHSGRRTFATTLIEKGVDIEAVSTLMGHASIATTAQYVEDSPVRLKQISADIL